MHGRFQHDRQKSRGHSFPLPRQSPSTSLRIEAHGCRYLRHCAAKVERVKFRLMPSLKNCLVIIPARMASTRLPGKPLADIHGLPMIAHVWQRAMEANLGRVVVAAAEQEIVHAIRAVGGEAVLTDATHTIRLRPSL